MIKRSGKLNKGSKAKKFVRVTKVPKAPKGSTSKKFRLPIKVERLQKARTLISHKDQIRLGNNF